MPENEPTTAESLRLLADWYEQRPDTPKPMVWVKIWTGDKSTLIENLASTANALGPECVKEVSSYDIKLTRKFGNLEFQYSLDKSTVCRKVERWECPETLKEMLDLTPEDLEAML